MMSEMTLKEFEFCKIDVWKFIEKEVSVLVGKRSKNVVCLPLKDIYHNSRLEGDYILLKNRLKDVAWWCPKDIDREEVLFPRYLKVTPMFIEFAAWAEGEFGESPQRNPQFSSSSYQEHNWIMEQFEKIFKYPRKRFKITIQYAQKVLDKLSTRDIEKEIQKHLNNLQGISIDQIKITSSGIRGKQSEKAPTINIYYNPDMFELILALAHSIVHIFPKIIRGKMQLPPWLIGSMQTLKTPIAYIDVCRLAQKDYSYNLTVDGKVSIWKTRRHSVIINKREIPINFDILLWVAMMIAEGTKGKTEFMNADPDVINIVLNGLKQIYDTSTIDIHFDVLIGEKYHEMIHHFLNEPLERHLQTQTVPRCTNPRVISLILDILFDSIPLNDELLELKRALWGIPRGIDHRYFSIPELRRYRFYRLRVDRMGKKSNLRVEINFKGTAADFTWKFILGVFFDLDEFVSKYGRIT